MRKIYQGAGSKSKQVFEVIGNRKLLVEMPLLMVEVWEGLQAEVAQWREGPHLPTGYSSRC